jgi:hypothetical protein
MGRGRQKAKHTKIARELKAYSPELNVAQLERELAPQSEEDLYVDKWADQYPDDEDDD